MTSISQKTPGRKLCIGCHKKLSSKKFYLYKNSLSSRCKTCYNKHTVNRYRKELKRYHDYLRTKSCVDCGIDNPIVLTHDHRDPKKKFLKVSAMAGLYSWQRVQEEINKCDVVCANCHAIRTAKQQGWYE